MKQLSLGVVISSKQASRRLDQIIQSEIEKNLHVLVSRKRVKQWFQSQAIQVTRDSKVIPSRSSSSLSPGIYRFDLFFPTLDWLQPRIAQAASSCFLEILYESSHLLVLNKPSGIHSQPIDPHEKNTAVNAALAHLPALESVGLDPLEPGLLHRLDSDTSGVLCFAKTKTMFDFLKTHWNRRRAPRVRKTYRAIVTASKKPKPQWIEKSLIAHQSSKKMNSSRAKAALPALTQIVAVRSLENQRYDLTLEILTGVRHQIRAHLASLKMPVLGDSVYNGASYSRLCLHAWKLELPLSKTSKKTVLIEAPLPKDWGV